MADSTSPTTVVQNLPKYETDEVLSSIWGTLGRAKFSKVIDSRAQPRVVPATNPAPAQLDATCGLDDALRGNHFQGFDQSPHRSR